MKKILTTAAAMLAMIGFPLASAPRTQLRVGPASLPGEGYRRRARIKDEHDLRRGARNPSGTKLAHKAAAGTIGRQRIQ